MYVSAQTKISLAFLLPPLSSATAEAVISHGSLGSPFASNQRAVIPILVPFLSFIFKKKIVVYGKRFT